ncbi:hypothetical protein RFI_00868 [Reticulomyxa filosa]|uniref:Uncharacterized protein n=1 Tax=Reticulomyxa filosa TaxID=46433 RepID=X6PCE2_RETFI|nr:hypothetical protein RFI_00868 [Reticulomyxa filosa]|eukprot:ETO36195.1 hypothetical protein RFI_00868 [Reticulomyxa filosa]
MIDNVNKRRQYIEIKPIDRNQMMQDKSNIGFYKCEWKRIGVKERIFVKKLKARFCNHGKRYLFIFKVKIKEQETSISFCSISEKIKFLNNWRNESKKILKQIGACY